MTLMPMVYSPADAAQITDTQTKFSMLCIAEKGTGFDWKNNDWVISSYRPNSYIVTKVEPDNFLCRLPSVSQPITPLVGIPNEAESKGCYELKEIGQKYAAAYACRERLGDNRGRICTPRCDLRWPSRI